MIDVKDLLQKLDDDLEKVSAKKEPESFLNPLFNQIQEYQKGIRQVQAQLERRFILMRRVLTLNF